VAGFDPTGRAKDAMALIDCDPSSPEYGRVVGWSELPTAGNELHHFGWNACSSALCHEGHGGRLERRYLIVPGIRSSRIHVLDTKPDPRKPRLVRTIEAEELAAKAGYSRPHTIHCGPCGVFVFARRRRRQRRPGGIAMLDHETFDVVGPWELDRGDQHFGSTTVLVAQAVPGATTLPCVVGLPSGWHSEGGTVHNGEASFTLNAGVGGSRVVTVTLAATCDLAAARAVDTHQRGIERFDSGPRRVYRFAGGCVTYEFTWSARRPAAAGTRRRGTRLRAAGPGRRVRLGTDRASPLRRRCQLPGRLSPGPAPVDRPRGRRRAA